MGIKENYGIITIHGTFEIYIQNFTSILELEENKVCIRTQNERLNIMGKKLIIDYMSQDELKISGIIENLKIVGVGE